MAATKQDNLNLSGLDYGDGLYRVISNDNTVKSIAGVGPISITGNINPPYGEITDLQLGFNMKTSGLTNYYTKLEINHFTGFNNYYTKNK